MASYRALWEESYWEDNLPPWPCPSCPRGNLRLRDDSFAIANAPNSGPVPDEHFGTFSCLLVCERCKQPVAMTGDFEGAEHRTDSGTTERLLLSPKSMVPGSPLIELPDTVPAPVADAIRQAHISFWGDRGAAANRLRISVERIMDAEGIDPKKKLADRIDDFAVKYPKLEDQLDALRLVGNVGSHDGDVGRDVLLDAFESYQHWLRNFYGKYDARMTAMTAKLLAKKGRY